MATTTSTETPAQMRERATALHQQADLLPVWESRAIRQQSAMLRAEARELVALAAYLQTAPTGRRYGLGDLATTREIGA